MKCKKCDEEIDSKKKFCSKKCYFSYNRKIIKCKFCDEEFEVGKSSKRIYCGNICAAQDLGKVRANSAKETLMKKYGVEHQSQLQSVKDKVKKKRESGSYDNMVVNMKKTNLKRHGAVNYNNVEKNKQTKLKKYGDKNYNNREKFKETMIDRYGSVCPPGNVERTKELASKGIIGFKSEKFKQFLEENDVENVSQLPIVKEKVRKRVFKNMYDKFLNTERLGKYIKPLFTLEEYSGSAEGRQKKYKFKCLVCDNEFEDNLYSGHIPVCRVCNPIMKPTSGLEKEIVDYIKEISEYEIKENIRSILTEQRELDIYIPNKFISIEVDGLYWHSELNGKDKKYHLNKTIECEKQGIQLIHIFEDEWKYKQDIVKEKLKHIFNENGKDKIYARNCEIIEIDSKTKNDFLNKHHIQGEDKSKTKLGAYYNNELVGIMTFGKKRISLGNKSEENKYELIRYATSKIVVGLASKLLSRFIKNYNPIEIISYADRRWTQTNNNLYDKIGFKKVSNGVPSYWYMKGYLERMHRFNFRKNILNEKLEDFDSNITEWENMQVNGYDRIWDCGHLKYVWEK